jgi:putative PEP-CTERM system TPR-repeat lipoprotein
LRAVLLAEAKDYASADGVLARIAPATQGIPRADFLLALVKRALQQMEQAENAASRYVTRTPDDLQGVKLLATLQIQKHEAEAAIGTLTAAAARGRADQQTYDLLAQAYTEAGRQDEAVQSLERAAALAPDNARMRARLAAARMGAGNTDAAIADLEASLAMAPGQPAIGPALFFAELSTGDLDRATAALGRVRAAQGDTMVVRNLDGLLKMAQLDSMQARAIFEKILKDDPGFTTAKLNLARLDVMQGRPDAAQKLTSEILAKEPLAEPAFSLNQALLLQQGRVADAMAALERARIAAPADPRPTIALAELYQRSGDGKRALDLLAPAAGDAADQPLPLIAARARLSSAAGKAPQARDALRTLLARDPASLDARLGLIAASMQDRDYEAARTLVQEGLRLSPRNYQLLSSYPAIDLKATGIDAALATADRLRKQNQDFELARALRGDVYMEAQQYGDAAEAYEAANAAAPSQTLAMREANALARAGHPDQAADVLRRWLTRDPGDVAALKALASLDIATGKLDEALDSLQKAIGQSPRDAVALNNLAWLYQQMGDGRAREIAQKAYVLLPNAQTADTLGWILVSGGDTEKGLMLLRQANAQSPADPNITYHYAAALNNAGQRSEAVRLLAPLVSGNQDFAEKAGAQRLLSELSKG